MIGYEWVLTLSSFILMLSAIRLLLLDIRSKTNLFGALFMLNLSWYRMVEILLLNANGLDEVVLRYRILGSFIVNPFLAAMAFAYFAKIEQRVSKVGIYTLGLFLLIPSLATSLFWMFSDHLYTIIKPAPDNIIGYSIHCSHPLDFVGRIWYIVNIIIGFYFIWKAYKDETLTDKKRKKRVLLFFTLLVTCYQSYVQLTAMTGDSALFNPLTPFVVTPTAVAFAFMYSDFKLFQIQRDISFSHLVHDLSNPVLIVDKKDQIIEANRAALQLNNKWENNFPAKTLNEFLNQLQMKPDQDLLEEIQTGQKPMRSMFVNGVLRHYVVTATPVSISKKDPKVHILLFTDITKEQNTNLALQQANEELEVFAGMASHDLQSPLRSINSFTFLLKKELSDKASPKALECFQFITNASLQMQQLTKATLSYMQVKKTPLTYTEIALPFLFDQIKRQLKTSKGIIQYDSLPSLTSDYQTLYQIAVNLIENGLKYNTAKQPTVTIHYQETSQKHQLLFTDNGIGIPEEYHDIVFQMFKRLHTDAEYQGTGLGLAICQKLALKIGGNLQIQKNNSSGEGTCFILSLPQTPVPIASL